MLKDIEAVLFDLDGSLVDSMWIWKDIDIAFLSKFNINMPEDLQNSIDGKSFYETAVYFKERFQIPNSIEDIMDMWNEMAWEKYASEVPLKKGALSFLKHCRSNGIKLGIATSNSRELVENVIEVHGIKDYFDGIVTGCDVKRGKPAPDVYLEAARQCKANPEKCLVFEDIVQGILAGKAAGMKVCAVDDEYSAAYEKEKRQYSDYYITDYCEVI